METLNATKRFELKYSKSLMGYGIIDNSRKNDQGESWFIHPSCGMENKDVVQTHVDDLNEGKRHEEYGIFTKEELLEYLANATVTYYQCGGHKKSDRNEEAIKWYNEQLKSMGILTPTTDELLKKGIFNGKGSK